MAKIQTTINKSEMIRQYKLDNPEAKPKEIAEALTSQTGEEFSNTQVSTVLNNAKKKGLTNGQATMFSEPVKPQGTIGAPIQVGAPKTAPKAPTQWSMDAIASGESDPRALLLVIQAAEHVGISGVRKILESLENIKK